MKNAIASVFALMIGFFTLMFAAVMGLFIGVAALIAKPFLKRKMQAAYEDAVQQQATFQGFTRVYTDGKTIDGEFEDITHKPASAQ